jgi:hypothetical protein
MGFKSPGVASLNEFHLVGLDGADLNKIYRTAARFGKSCKFSFNMSEKNKVVNRGYLSFITIKPEEVEQLKADLSAIGIMCEPYDRKKQKKITIKVENFAENFKKDSTELLLARVKSSEEKFRKLLADTCKFEDKDYKLGVTAVPKDDLNSLIAYLSFDEPKKAVQAFNELKNAKTQNYFEKTPVISIRLSDENESYTNLITVGLVKKDAAQSETQFEE